MASVKCKTNFLGVRYREHGTRKHGIRFDRCFFVRYKKDGKDKEEMAGWASEGMSAEKAFSLLSIVRENIRQGTGAQSLAEIREANEVKKVEATREATAAKRKAITIAEFWDDEYLPYSNGTKKASSMSTERLLYKNWIMPAIGKVSLQRLTPAMVEKIVFTMQKHNRAAASIRYMIAVISQMWTLASARDIVQGDSPTKKVKKPKADNRRMRFLTKEEAHQLLEALKLRSIDTHDASLLSLLTGLRSGEIWELTWGDINFENNTIYIRDPKNKNSRHAFMTNEVKAMFEGRYVQQHKTAYCFPARGGGKRKDIPDTFERVVRALGFNSTGELNADNQSIEIKDTRQRVVFHTLRHTFASWLAQAGTPMFTLSQLMGHQDMKMTQRYSHLAPDAMQIATMALQGFLAPKQEKVIAIDFRRKAVNGGTV